MIGPGSDKDIGFQKGQKMVTNRGVIKCLPTVPVIRSISPKLVHRGVPSKYLFESLQNTFLSLFKVPFWVSSKYLFESLQNTFLSLFKLPFWVSSKYLFESLQTTFLSLIKVLLYSRDLSILDSVLLDSFYQLELWALFLLFTIQFLILRM